MREIVKMLLESRIWQALQVFAILVTAFVTLYAAFHVPGPFTEKHLQSTVPISTDVVTTSDEFGDRMKISIIVDNTPVKNLVLSIASVTNTGYVPIIPSDFYEKLSINVGKEWNILLVKNSGGKSKPIWTKVNNQKFEASPELLNPKDSITILLYATNIQLGHLTYEQSESLKPFWSAHILNLQSITQQPNVFAEANADPMIKIIPVIVELYGAALVETLAGTIFFMVIYLRLLYELDVIGNASWQSVVAIIIVMMISLTSSEAMTTYLFPSVLTKLQGVNHWFNMPFIVLNLVALVWLIWKTREARGRRQASSDT
jgi:hypothetical protein